MLCQLLAHLRFRSNLPDVRGDVRMKTDVPFRDGDPILKSMSVIIGIVYSSRVCRALYNKINERTPGPFSLPLSLPSLVEIINICSKRLCALID